MGIMEHDGYVTGAISGALVLAVKVGADFFFSRNLSQRLDEYMAESRQQRKEFSAEFKAKVEDDRVNFNRLYDKTNENAERLSHIEGRMNPLNNQGGD